LNQALTERDEQTINLNQALTERDEQTINLNHALTERDQQIINLNQTIEAVYLSTSWFITKPLRELSRWGQRLMRLIRLYKNYRRIYPGLSGIWRLVKRSIDAIRKGGITNLRTSIGMHSRSCTKVAKITLSSVLQLRDINDKADNLHNDVAVHAHIFYPDLATEIRNYLANIPVKFHCYVTTDTQDKAKLIETVFSDLRSIRTLEIYVVENKGRDLAPMIVGLGKMLVKHEVVLHIHSKRSPHNPALRGWRRYLMMSLLGSKQGVAAILQQFSQNKQLGILYPQTYNPVIPFMKIGGNEPFMADLLNRAGKKTAEIERIDLMNFPAGGMFWFRGKAIEPLVNMGLSLPDFDAEAGQDDGTLAHAIERLFLYFASDSGLYHQSYVPKQLSSSQPGTMPLSRLQDFCNQGLINKPVIMFDHNIGGGANHYGRELMKSILTDGNSVLRIYWANERWFVEWVGVDDGMILVALNEDDMFGTLAMTASRKIIVNSLYGYPNVDDISHRIVDLTHQLDATLDFKVHDFYAICPSQHLLDFNEKYCAVPQNHSTCNSCLKKNSAAYWASSQPVDIERWRSSFARLFEAADVISVFNISSIEILQKGFQLEPHKAIITHHSDDYFKCNKFVLTSGQLHVGVLGTLTTAKGAMVVNSLAEHIDSLGMKMPVTVVGRSVVPVMSRIKVLGNYDNYNLPEIVIHEGINVILMPSIVPETFSYTISEAMKMGLPIVTFDLGAQGNRVKQYELGEVVPLGSSPEVILAAIESVLKKAQELRI
ncbi:rhamnan synthesis F family protein, partial [Acinetobacter sp.]|uniref:rhamnan synthesis F family protein n=1 Tax=Acinetobacter sp. TaxID=472 RepID=UPI003753BFED